MVKFDYANEFYRKNIFPLSNVKLFKEKVEEAKEIDKYFFNILPNINFIREYIIYSYVFEKNLTMKDRINYIRGLVYASDYVDMDDLFSISNDIKMINNFKYDPDSFLRQNKINSFSNKNSIWKFTAYFSSTNGPNFLNQLEESAFVEISVYGKDDDMINDKNALKQLLKTNIPNVEVLKIEDIDENDNFGDSFISVENKVKLFEKNIDNYIEKTLSLKLEEKKISVTDMLPVVKAMNKWFDFIFTSMEDIVELENRKLVYRNENLFDML